MKTIRLFYGQTSIITPTHYDFNVLIMDQVIALIKHL